ncbi:MAG: electron transfer flavoprotein subunit beta [Deltaproteobacteria bacterium]|jgi:electron transfer flavoprotein beta subunit|nr:electron transfer flavoprotein subunit beta [Deltaproteobacteria bacterium]
MTDSQTQFLVILREVCDPKPPVRLTADGFGVRERGLRYMTNPADLCALEMALEMSGSQQGAVTVVAIGPSRLDDHLRLAMAMGASRACRVWHSALEGSDMVADARVIARIVDILKPDFVFTGQRLLDSGDNPAPALAAANLGMPYVTAALSTNRKEELVEVLRKSDRGATQVVATQTPCAIMFEAGCCEPRYPSHEALVSALEQDIELWGVAELGLRVHDLGSAGAVLKKDRCSFPRANPQRVETPDANLPAFERILALLSGGIKPREGKVHALSVDDTVEQLMTIFKSEGLIDGSSP